MFTFNPESAVSWNWLQAKGSDSIDFFHRISTTNVNALKEGSGQSTFLLQSTGKIDAYFKLWKLDQKTLGLEFEAGPENSHRIQLEAAIDKLLFTEDLKLILSTDECRWVFLESGEKLKEVPEIKENQTRFFEELQICHHGSTRYGWAWFSIWGKKETLSEKLNTLLENPQPIDFETLEARRIQNIQPRVGLEITQDRNPLELGLQSVISQNKGCYPGQEVIEKIISYGSPPKRLALIEVQLTSEQPIESAPLAVPIFQKENPTIEVGTLTSLSKPPAESSSVFALGILKKVHSKENLAVQFKLNPSQENAFQGRVVKISAYEQNSNSV